MDGDTHPAAPIIVGPATVAAVLSDAACIAAVRRAMTALSAGETRQLVRTYVPLGGDRILGIMPGALGADAYFGAKLVSVFPDPAAPGRSAHRGVVVLFEPGGGRPVCFADAEEVTLIRTAAASAVATEALAREDARRLAILGCGRQAGAHVRAIHAVRPIETVEIWGRDPRKAEALAAELRRTLPVEVRAEADAAAAVWRADVVCAVTGAKTPVLRGAWLAPGVHVNLVGSSGPDALEADTEVVTRARYVVDSRESALVKAAEFLKARNEGLVDETHIAGEIGEVIAGTRPGRTAPLDITVYKSVGHAVQDLAAAAYVYDQIRARAPAGPAVLP